MLSDRQKKIVDLILKHPQGINASLISKEVNVSSRTIRNDIASINVCLMNNHCMINSSKRIGYFIVRDSVEKVKDCILLMDAINHKQIASTPMERKYYILGQLIQFQHVNMYDIASILYVSEQTVYKDLVTFQKTLKDKFHFESLVLENGELVLYDNEEEIRSLFYRLVKEEIYLSNKLIDIHLYQLSKDIIDIEELYAIVEYISGYCRAHEIIILDQVLYMISWMLLFTITRVENGCLLHKRIQLQHKNDELQKMLHIILTDLQYEIEVEDMTLLQNYMETLGLFTNQQTHLVSSVNEKIINDFTNEMKNKYNLDFESMPSLLENFKNHLEFAIKRLLMDYQLINPLLQEVKTKYSFAYEIAMLIVPIVYKQYNLYMQVDELSFLALYIQPFLKVQNTNVNILLVYGTTQSFTKFIENWIIQEFKERIHVVGCAPAYKLEEEIKINNVDLIISNVELEKKFVAPVIQITQLPMETDRVKIENFISRQASVSASMNIFRKVFSVKQILIINDEMSYESIVEKCAKCLEEEQKIVNRQEFINAVIEREKVYSTHIENGCFMPHPLMNTAKCSAICLAIVKSSALKDNHNIKLMFVSGFEPRIEADLKYIYNLVNKVATSEELVNVVMNLKTSEEVMDYLEKIIQIMKD